MPTYSNYNTTPAQVDSTKNPSYIQFIDNLIQGADVIFLDTDTAAKCKPFEELIKTISPMLAKYKKKIIFPQAGMHELRQQATSIDTRTREKAERTLEGLNALSTVGIVGFRGNPNLAETAGEYIIKYVCQHIFDEDIVVLTQDGDLARDCRLFGDFKSTHMNHTVVCKRISDAYGRLNNFEFRSNSTEDNREDTIAPQNNSKEILKRYGQ